MTTFRRSTRIYRLAMSYNRGLDRDKDGIACEKGLARALCPAVCAGLAAALWWSK